MVNTQTTSRPVLADPWRHDRPWYEDNDNRSGTLRVLVVDNDEHYVHFLADGLGRSGCTVFEARTGGHALRTYHNMDLVLLGLTLPDMDGVGVCRIIRATDDIPIIALTAQDTESERILALRAGMDDCVSRPCGDTRELLARIEAVMRRIRPQSRHAPATLVRGSLYINPTTREVWVDDRLIEVTRKEFELLYRLAERAGAVVPRRHLMEEIWGFPPDATGFGTASRTIDTHVNTLRRKLGASEWIRTVRGVGFRFDEISTALKETS